uniref:Pheromone binding protein 17 n=1 Tax=Cyrtotrachelus buqueti TaxID=1892066 RepID=A0A1L3KPU2_9CUCU|nr:pheromone binding protein 17 [Cyrtotrachelus buqueti]
MKLLIFAVFLLVTLFQVKCQTDKQKELLAQHYKQCVEQTHVDQNVLQQARAGNFTDDPKLKDHILCITKKIGFQDEAGHLQKEVIQKKLKEAVKGNEDQTKKLMEACAITNQDPKLQAFNAFKCIHHKAKINLL